MTESTPVVLELFAPNRVDAIVDDQGRMTIRMARFFEILVNDLNGLSLSSDGAFALNLQLLQEIKKLKRRVELLEASHGG